MNEPGRDADFTAFAAAARPPLSRTAWLLTGSRQQAEDLVQDALVRTYLAWHRVRRDDALSYARAVLVNRHVDVGRKSRRELAAWKQRGADPDVAPDSPHDLGDDRDEVVRAMLRLRPRERAVVVLRYYADLTEAQVARELGVSVGTVKSTASRALAKLRMLDEADAGQARPHTQTDETTAPSTQTTQTSQTSQISQISQVSQISRAALGAVVEPRGRA